MTKLQNTVLMATIGAAQGLKGEVRVNSHTAEPLSLTNYRVFADGTGKKFELERGRLQKNIVIAKFKGVEDRTAAEKLSGTQLFVDRAVLEAVAVDDDEFLYADLVGLEVSDESGRNWGHVAAVFEFGAGDILEIKGLDGKLRMIPFSKVAVPIVNVAGGSVQIDLAASGIVDEAPTQEDLQGGDA